MKKIERSPWRVVASPPSLGELQCIPPWFPTRPASRSESVDDQSPFRPRDFHLEHLQAIAPSADLAAGGWGPRRLGQLWLFVVLACGVAAALGFMGPTYRGPCRATARAALAAGSLLAMLTNSLIPFSFERGHARRRSDGAGVLLVSDEQLTPLPCTPAQRPGSKAISLRRSARDPSGDKPLLIPNSADSLDPSGRRWGGRFTFAC